MKELDTYFKEKTENLSFIEIKPETYVDINGYKVYSDTPLPLIIDELIIEIKEKNAQDEVKMSSIINGMIYTIGVDPEFKHCEKYKSILYKYDEKIEEYILYNGLKKINEGSFEDGMIWLRSLRIINDRNTMGIYNYGLALEEKAKRLFASNNESLGTLFLRKATESFEKVINIESKFSPSYYKLGYHYKNSKQFKKSQLMWEKYIQLGNDEELLQEVREGIEAIKDDVTYEEGYLLILNGNAEEGLEKLLPLKEKYVGWWNLLFMIGLGYRQLERFEEAKAEFINVLDIVPEQADALNELGLCLVYLGDVTQAIDMFSKAIEIKPNDYEIICNRGMTYLQSLDISSAEKDILRAYAINSEDEITIACKNELDRIKNMG